jgi:hypothetical protein
LKKHERNYSVTHLELLAVIWALKKFRHYILGTKFIVQTDHIALQSIRNTKDIHTGRMARWVLALQEYEPFEVQYCKGVTNTNADALSRLPLEYNHHVKMIDIERKYDDVKEDEKIQKVDDIPAFNNVDIGQLQQRDTQWKQIYKCVNNPEGDHDEKVRHESEQYAIHDGVLYRRYLANNKARSSNLILQLCLPQQLVPDILHEMHDEPYSGHLGTDKTWGRIFNRYYWKQMHQDIAHYCVSCEVCARRKLSRRLQGIPILSP